jgi:hypothetical protein
MKIAIYLVMQLRIDIQARFLGNLITKNNGWKQEKTEKSRKAKQVRCFYINT